MGLVPWRPCCRFFPRAPEASPWSTVQLWHSRIGSHHHALLLALGAILPQSSQILGLQRQDLGLSVDFFKQLHLDPPCRLPVNKARDHRLLVVVHWSFRQPVHDDTIFQGEAARALSGCLSLAFVQRLKRHASFQFRRRTGAIPCWQESGREVQDCVRPGDLRSKKRHLHHPQTLHFLHPFQHGEVLVLDPRSSRREFHGAPQASHHVGILVCQLRLQRLPSILLGDPFDQLVANYKQRPDGLLLEVLQQALALTHRQIFSNAHSDKSGPHVVVHHLRDSANSAFVQLQAILQSCLPVSGGVGPDAPAGFQHVPVGIQTGLPLLQLADARVQDLRQLEELQGVACWRGVEDHHVVPPRLHVLNNRSQSCSFVHAWD
mmetsp:Transcript_29906/g.76854  ORF Transcript_29906/g.76854 Transcript_29906/m.76854 type:complete len:376 (-) Transcript_29906:414-1541(-)